MYCISYKRNVSSNKAEYVKYNIFEIYSHIGVHCMVYGIKYYISKKLYLGSLLNPVMGRGRLLLYLMEHSVRYSVYGCTMYTDLENFHSLHILN